MQQVYDGKLRRVLAELVAQHVDGRVEAQVGGHDAVVDVDVVVLDGRTQVEGTDSHVPLLLEALLLRTGILVSEGTVDGCRDAGEAVAGARVVAAGDGERGDVGIVGQTHHPVVGNERQAKRWQQGEKQKEMSFHVAGMSEGLFSAQRYEECCYDGLSLACFL